jgi:site-specific recombinase XerD
MGAEMDDLIDRFLSWKVVSQGRSEQTAVKYRLYLLRLKQFCKDRQLDPLTIGRDELEIYTGIFSFKEKEMGAIARRAVVAAVKGFYKYLEREGTIKKSPAADLAYPKKTFKLPVALPIDAAERLMWAPDLNEFIGVRDAAMLGLLIGCGIRVAGLVGLNMSHLDWSAVDGLEQLSILVTEKGNKERIVPVPDEARLLLRAYLGHEQLERLNRSLPDGDQVLFVSTRNRMVPASDLYGETLRLSDDSVREMIIKYGEKAGIPRHYLHPHAMRHLFGRELTEDDVDAWA